MTARMRRIAAVIASLGLAVAVVATVVTGAGAVTSQVAEAAASQAPHRATTASPVPAPSAVTPTPVAAAPVPSATPDPVYSGPLVAPTGFLVRSDAEIERFFTTSTWQGDTQHDILIRIAQAKIERDCMAAHGFVWDPIYHAGPVYMAQNGVDYARTTRGLDAAQIAAWNLADWGTNMTDSGPYVWQHAGCQGLAVHETGQDDAH